MIFQPVAIETLGPLNASALNFLREVGRWLTSLSGDSDLISVPAPLIADMLQICSDYGRCFFDEDPDL